jgi:hypothetical protein
VSQAAFETTPPIEIATLTDGGDGAPIRSRGTWLFSPTIDLSVFLGSAVLSLVLLAVGWAAGVLHGETPGWAWVPAILLVDVAHVYSTGFRVYFDPAERRRRPLLYYGVPLAAFGVGAVVHAALGAAVFWTVLAYLAVFHFVRQQWGWVALYRARAGETDRLGRRLDAAAIYAATVYPLIAWHARLPREFDWFLPGDFLMAPAAFGWLAAVAEPVYWSVLALYAVRSFVAWRGGRANPGKDVVVVTTALCWYVGIIALNSDYAFTVTNVVIHGVPYMALVYWYWRRLDGRLDSNGSGSGSGWKWLAWFVGVVWLLAYAEELLWDRTVWQARGWLFGPAWPVVGWHNLIVPLLAVPQVTHYVLDGFIWKRQSNPQFARSLTRPERRAAGWRFD